MNSTTIVPEIPTVNRKKPFFGGFVMIPRNFAEEWPLYRDSAAKELFLHLLISARYCDGRTLKRGQIETSQRELCAELPGLSRQKIRTALAKLQSVGELAMESTHRRTVITLLKYDSYNGGTLSGNPLATEKQGVSTHHQPTGFGKAPKINPLIPGNQPSYQPSQVIVNQSRANIINPVVNQPDHGKQPTDAAEGAKSNHESTHWPPLLCTREYSTKLLEDRNSKVPPPAQRARVREGANHDDMGRRMFFSETGDVPEVPDMSWPVPASPENVPTGTREVPERTWRDMPDAPRWHGQQPAEPEDVFVPKPEEDWQAMAAAGNYRAAFEARVQVKGEVIDQILKSRNVSNEMFTAYLESRAACEFRGKSGRHLTNYSWLADLDIFCRHWRNNREKAMAAANPGRAREGEPWRPWLTQKWTHLAAAITGVSEKCGIAAWWATHGMTHGEELERRCRAVIAKQEDVRAYA